jgi:hypothetical protein
MTLAEQIQLKEQTAYFQKKEEEEQQVSPKKEPIRMLPVIQVIENFETISYN